MRFGGEQLWHEVWVEVFGEAFKLVLLGHSEPKVNSATTPAQNSHGSAQQSWRTFREKLHHEVLQGFPANSCLFQSSGTLQTGTLQMGTLRIREKSPEGSH